MSRPWLPSLSERLFEVVARVRYAGRPVPELRYRGGEVIRECRDARRLLLKRDRNLRLVKGARSHG